MTQVNLPPPPQAVPPGGPPAGGPPPRSGMGGGMIALIIGGVILVLALIGAGVYLLLRSGEEEVATPTVEAAEPEAAVPADIEVALRWSSSSDLDLQVFDPDGNGVSHAQPRVPSGGTLDRDANLECRSTTGSPVERISWPEGRAETGAYFVQVSYPLECPGGEGVQEFQLSVVLDGETVAMVRDDIEPGEVMDLLAFSYPAGIVDDWREFEDVPTDVAPPQPAPQAPQAPEPTPEPTPPAQAPANVLDLPSGLFCRDLYAMGYPYWDAVTYWESEGRTSRMDASNNGIPCQTVYPRQDVVDYWGIQVDPDFQEGGDVS
jgi:hypothetical protein